MSFGRQKKSGREAPPPHVAALLAALHMAFFLLALVSGALSGHTAQRGPQDVVPIILCSSSSYSIDSTIDTQKACTALATPSPYSVARGLTLAPYRTGDWGTIEPGQRYGINGREISSDSVETNQPEGAAPAKAVAAPAENPNDAASKAAGNAKTGKAQRAKRIIRLFSTVDFRSPLKDMPKWERVLQRERQSPSFTENGMACNSEKTAARWQQLKDSLQGASLMEKAKAVNSFFNKWPYRSDRAVWGVEDYWAVPCEFVVRSGDCEDYAIAKYFALRNLGVPADTMRIAAVRDTIRGIGHAVLVIYAGNEAYVLDNLSNLVLSHKRLKHYRPLFTVNENYLWRHVKPIAGPDSK